MTTTIAATVRSLESLEAHCAHLWHARAAATGADAGIDVGTVVDGVALAAGDRLLHIDTADLTVVGVGDTRTDAGRRLADNDCVAVAAGDAHGGTLYVAGLRRTIHLRLAPFIPSPDHPLAYRGLWMSLADAAVGDLTDPTGAPCVQDGARVTAWKIADGHGSIALLHGGGFGGGVLPVLKTASERLPYIRFNYALMNGERRTSGVWGDPFAFVAGGGLTCCAVIRVVSGEVNVAVFGLNPFYTFRLTANAGVPPSLWYKNTANPADTVTVEATGLTLPVGVWIAVAVRATTQGVTFFVAEADAAAPPVRVDVTASFPIIDALPLVNLMQTPNPMGNDISDVRDIMLWEEALPDAEIERVLTFFRIHRM